MTHNRCEAFSVMDRAAGGEMLWSPYELDNVFPAERFRQVSNGEVSEGDTLKQKLYY